MRKSIHDADRLKRLLDQFTRANTPHDKGDCALMIWIALRDHGEREKAFFVMLDYLYSRQIGNDNILAILQKYPLVSTSFTLTTAESDAVVTVMLNFLQENPATHWGDYYNYENNLDKFRCESMDRGGAAMLLSVLYDSPATSSSTKERIRQQENLIVDYYLSDYDHWGCAPTTLDVYLTNKL